MLPFFPTPYHDELLYSVFARYHKRSRNKSNKSTMEDIFAFSGVYASIDFNNHLQALYKRLPENSPLTPEYLIQNHTLFPLYQPFLPLDRSAKIIEWMKGSGTKGNIHKSVGVMASSIPIPEFLKYCLKCLEDDKQKYGEPYWHRSHQVFGIIICHKHRARLFDSNIKTTSLSNRQAFHALSDQIINYTKKSVLIDYNQTWNLYSSQAVYWLLNSNITSYGLNRLYEKYFNELQKHNLILSSGRIKQHELVSRFIQFHGYKLLNDFNVVIDPHNNNNWLNKLTRKAYNAIHPLQHILLMNFLGITPKEFFMSNQQKLPFGEGPWSCFNPITEHYSKQVINNISLKNNIIGAFACPLCGFTYTKVALTTQDGMGNHIKKVLSYGSVWENKLQELLLENKSNREIADILHVSPQMISKRIKQNTIVLPQESNSFHSKLEQKQQEWLNIIKKNPEKTRTQIKNLYYNEYFWLYNHAKEWLMTVMPEPKKFQKRGVNWRQRDEELSNRIQSFILTAKKTNEKPFRFTVKAIGVRLGILGLITQKLSKLPKTKIMLETSVESLEDFYLRNIRFIITTKLNNGENLNVPQIIHTANLSSQYSKYATIVKREIEIITNRNIA